MRLEGASFPHWPIYAYQLSVKEMMVHAGAAVPPNLGYSSLCPYGVLRIMVHRYLVLIFATKGQIVGYLCPVFDLMGFTREFPSGHLQAPGYFRSLRLYDLSIPPMTKSCSNYVSCVDIIDDPCPRHSPRSPLPGINSVGIVFPFLTLKVFPVPQWRMGEDTPVPQVSTRKPPSPRPGGGTLCH